jgi:hypothetical protein
MQYEEFKQELLEQLNSAAATSEHIKSFIPSSTTKLNDSTLDSITVCYEDNKNFRPCFYPEELYADYEDGRSMADIVDSIKAHAEYSYEHTPEFNFGDLTSDAVKANIYLQLVNGSTNTMIKDNCAFLEFNDLIAVPRCRVDVNGEVGSFLINKQIQSEMKLTDDELLSIARKNTLEQPYSLKSMAEVLGQSLGMDIPIDSAPPILVLSNEEGVNGSIHIINPKAMKEASEHFNDENLFIIPSSIHELLIMSESQVDDPAYLSTICADVNESVVSNTEVLSGSIYYYDSQKQKISICNNLEDLNMLQHPEQTNTQTRQHRQAM